MLFQNWNWYYLAMPVCLALYFIYGYSLHYADGCTVRDRKHLKDWQEIAIWAAVSAGLSAMVIGESYRGFFQITRIFLGGRGDDLDECGLGIFLMAVAVVCVFALVFSALVLGEAIGNSRARKQALAQRAYCRNHRRSEVCTACEKPQGFVCPVGVDRTPTQVIYGEDLLAMMKAIKTGEIDGEPVPYEFGVLDDGACEVFFNVATHKIYSDKPPRRLTTPPEFKVGGCVRATLALPGRNRTEEDISLLRALLSTLDKPLPVQPK